MSPMIGARDEGDLPLDFFYRSDPRIRRTGKKRETKKPARKEGSRGRNGERES